MKIKKKKKKFQEKKTHWNFPFDTQLKVVLL